jgi:chromosome segregation ATPase
LHVAYALTLRIYDSKRVKTLPTTTSYQQKFQDNIHAATIQYLQTHMFTLHLMPKITTTTQTPSETALSPTAIRQMTLDELERLDAAKKTLNAMVAQEEQLRRHIEDATKRRRIEDAQALREALSEVVVEVDRLKREVEEMEGGIRQVEVKVDAKGKVR